MKTLTSATLTLIALLALAGCKQPSEPSQVSTPAGTEVTASSPMEGTFEYVGTLRGQGILSGGSYMFLYGPADESAPMTSDAGVYQISDDTAKNTITYSTDPETVGSVYRFTIESTSGDTISYVVMDEAGEVTGGGQAVKRH
jgi:hypothetical protein